VAGRRLKNLRNDDLKTLIKFIVPLEGRDDKKCPSKYFKNVATMIACLEDCDQPWYKYIEVPSSEEESGEEDEAAEDKSAASD
jgi:hypothetical protein